MTFFLYLGALCCVIGLSIGQILFKYAAKSLSIGGSIFQLKTLTLLFFAFLIYGITSVGWVYILQKIDLGKVYPLMALAFIFVPLGSMLFFGESFTVRYLIGVTLIIFGILIAING